MATTKANTSIWAANTLTASAADETSASVNLVDGYGGQLHIVITNGATGPTVAAQVKVQISPDDSAWYDYAGPFEAQSANNGVYYFAPEVGVGVMYVRLVAGSNTGQDVTITASVAEVTAV